MPTSATSKPAQPATHVAVRNPSRKAGPVIMIACLLLAVMAVLFVPVLTGGAQIAASSALPVSSAPATVAEYTAPDPAVQRLSYEPALPAELPQGASVLAYRVLDNDTLEVEYQLEKATVVYRTAPGNDDLTGDYTDYAYTAYETVEEISRSYAGPSEKKLNIAFWAADGYSYALVAADGVDAETLREMAEAIS